MMCFGYAACVRIHPLQCAKRTILTIMHMLCLPLLMQQAIDLSFYTFVCLTGKPCDYIKYLLFS